MRAKIIKMALLRKRKAANITSFAKFKDQFHTRTFCQKKRSFSLIYLFSASPLQDVLSHVGNKEWYVVHDVF